jgi:thiamine-phosphate diphosphorylase
VEAALSAGVRLVQYRAKGPLTRGMVAEAKALADRAHGHGAHLVVNDRADLARMAGADGVHVGQDDLSVADARRAAGPGAWVGVSVHDPEEARAAEAAGADYLGFGNVFGTRTKADAGAPRGTGALAAVCERTALPVYAIGGVGADNLHAVKAAGAAGGAVISAVLGADSPPEAAGDAAARLLAAWDGAPGPA